MNRESRVVIRSAQTSDADRVAAIYNEGIHERCATFETEPRHVETIAARIADPNFPMVVATDESDSVIGWAGTSSYRARACYAGIAEFSIYVTSTARGRGVGRLLLDALIRDAAAHGYSKLVSRVFAFNAASRAMCTACGFREVGVYEKHGQLEGRWIDVVIVERLLL